MTYYSPPPKNFSPKRELQNVPFSRVSKTIVKSMTSIESDDGCSTTPIQILEDNQEDDESSRAKITTSSTINFSASESKSGDNSTIEWGKGSRSLDLKREKSRRLNEKYALMQKKMTEMAQDMTVSRRTPKLNRAFGKSSRTAGPYGIKNAGKYSKRASLVEQDDFSASGSSVSNLFKGGNSSGFGPSLEQQQQQWRNKDCSFQHNSFESDTLDGTSKSTTSTPHSIGSSNNTTPSQSHAQTYRWISQSSPTTTTNSLYSTPNRPNHQPINTRNPARRISSVWPPPSIPNNDPPSPSPIPRIFKDDNNMDIDLETNLTLSSTSSSSLSSSHKRNGIDEQSTSTSPEENIYTRQLFHQKLGLEDAARPPLLSNNISLGLDDEDTNNNDNRSDIFTD
ncbi:12918_t:CDS:2 [Ambispora gerdemannii]|uniref:12918_t:CDS:1 n=1 Tax=Ambispora gerdemannii TaxID=144530 RepID=A0A9N9AU17_9GLOM|nr:12918_t:CDS:2 [Ambispora gerdemannii]